MAPIEHTPYLRFKRSPLAMELDALYTLTGEELDFARTLTRKSQPRLKLLLQLKAFQYLGYFPTIDEIPLAIMRHAHSTAGIDADILVYGELRTLYRHHQAIRERLELSAWDENGLRVASEAMSASAEMNACFPENKTLGIDESGLHVLKRSMPREPKASARAFETALLQRIDERNVTDVLCNAAPKTLQRWLNLERVWQCIEAINGKLKEWAFPTDLALAHISSAVRKTSRPHTARIRDESQPAHSQGKAS